MAKRLIDDMSDNWDPSKYHDTFRDDILALVEKKVKQGKVAEMMKVDEGGEHKASADILDLSELLKRSLRKAARHRSGAVRHRRTMTTLARKPRVRPARPRRKRA